MGNRDARSRRRAPSTQVGAQNGIGPRAGSLPGTAAVPSFACLTSDLIGSKQYADRETTQRRLERVLEAANAEFAGVLVVPLSITLGDEWQGLLRSLGDAFRLDFYVRRAIYPARSRSGIGWGPVSTKLRERTSLMDGPCFHRSREAISLAKKHRGSSTVLQSGHPAVDDFVNAMDAVLYSVFDEWTPKQFASVIAYLDQGTETKAAALLGVSQPTLHKSIHGASGRQFLAASQARIRFLEQLADLSDVTRGDST